MPILKAEADIFPSDLFDLPVDCFPWWVVHVRSRQEKLAAREAHARRIPLFLPLYEQIMRRDGRRRASYLPLFPGYLFFRGGLDVRSEMLKTNLCVRILEVCDQASLASDLLQIRKLQLAGEPLVAHPELKAGDTVRVTDGPFRGISGVILTEKGKTRLIVAVRFIHRAVSVELPRDVLVPDPLISRPESQGRHTG